VLVNACNRFGLIVIGYSGRDVSVMEALHESPDGPSPFTSGLRWVVRTCQQPLEAVGSFIEAATAATVATRSARSSLEGGDSAVPRVPTLGPARTRSS